MFKPELPRMALSIMQPWSWLIVQGYKDIENRNWQSHNPGLRFRGPVCIHAGKMMDRDALEDLTEGDHPVTWDALPGEIWTNLPHEKEFQTGGIVGVAEIVDVVTKSDSEWFVGSYGLVLRNAKPVEFIPVKGALGFFDWRRQLEVSRC